MNDENLKIITINKQDYYIFQNKRKGLNDFPMKYSCNFCKEKKYHNYMLALPVNKIIYICKSCLTDMISALDKVELMLDEKEN